MYSLTDLGPTTNFFGVPYTLAGPVNSNFNAACGLASPYTGTGGNCDDPTSHPTGCAITQTAGPFNAYTGLTTYYSSAVSPGPLTSWQLTSTTTGTIDVQLTKYGDACPSIGTVITTSSGPAEWQSLATGGGGPGTATSSNSCSADPRYTCTWTMSQDIIVPGETTQHFCRFTRPQFNWQQYAQQCTYQTKTYLYTTVYGDDYCRYKHYRDVFTHPVYTYSYIPNDGDIVGFTSQTFIGNDDLHGLPNAVGYAGGQFANGDCPNLIQNSATAASCRNGVICKLSWRSNTTLGATTYPNGRYSLSPYGGWPWVTVPAGFVQAADPVATSDRPELSTRPDGLRDGLARRQRPPGPLLQVPERQHLQPDGHQSAEPTRVQPAATCTYQYAYKDPPTVDAAGFSAVATAMPSNRDSGSSRLHDGRTAISWTPLALNSALVGRHSGHRRSGAEDAVQVRPGRATPPVCGPRTSATTPR